MLTSALLVLALAQTPQHRLFLQPNLPRGGGVALCDALASGDKAGNWWCMKGDGTMASGSAVTLTATGSPTNTIENGWPVRTYTSTQNDQEPANVAFPASDFSVCQHLRPGTVAVSQLAVFGTTGAAATNSTLPFEVQSGAGNLVSYVSDGVAQSSFASTPALTAGRWDVLCFTYQRVGGATNNVATVYLNGISIASSSTARLAQALVSVWTTNGYAGGIVGMDKAVRGAFVTYKLLSAADIARITAGMAP